MNTTARRLAPLASLAFALIAGCSNSTISVEGTPYAGATLSIDLYGPPDALGASLQTRISLMVGAQGTATAVIDDNIIGFGGIQVVNLQDASAAFGAAFPLVHVDGDHFTSTAGPLKSVSILLRRERGSSACVAIIDQVVTAQGVRRTDYVATDYDTEPCANFRP